MAEILSRGAVCDGYDVRVLTGGAAYVLHFTSEPTDATVQERIAALEASLVPPEYVILGEADA